MSCEPGTVYNIEDWIEENKSLFLPPICNKMMYYKGQMKCFFVGGPNQRKDFHLECGEELFYMRKGDMVLKVVEKDQYRDIPIKEGQIFLLSARIPHSPQRKADTVGLVLERERGITELDGLRYFVEQDDKMTKESLYEEWFYCDDLGSLGPVVKRFFESEQSKTGKPIPGTIPEIPPIVVDKERELKDPFNLHEWLEAHKEEINREGRKRLYPDSHQFQVFMYGQGNTSDYCEHAQTFIWQLEGCSTIEYQDLKPQLNKDDSMLVPAAERFTIKQEIGSYALVSYQDPTKSTTWEQ